MWGNKSSVLVGDFLFSRAFELMVEDGNLDVLRILSQASSIIAEGEVLQLVTANDTETTEAGIRSSAPRQPSFSPRPARLAPSSRTPRRRLAGSVPSATISAWRSSLSTTCSITRRARQRWARPLATISATARSPIVLAFRSG